jgi:hypothetical protein
VACFRNGTPTVDGILAGDFGWTNAFRYVVYNGSSVTDVAWEGIRSDATQSLFLSFLVNNDGTWDANDAIVVTISPGTGGTANDRRIQIFPFTQNTAASGTGAPPREVRYWKDSDHWNIAGNAANNPLDQSQAPDTWLSNNIKVSSSGANTWMVEMRIPIVANASDEGINLPAAPAQFKIWVDFLVWHDQQTPNVTPSAEQFSWPSGVGLTGGTYSLVSRNTPPPTQWGGGVLTNANVCNGVNFAGYDIAIVHPAGSTLGTDEIAWNQPNDFTVTAHNDAVDASGNYIASNQVFAKFYVANWGIPSLPSWQQVAVSGGPSETPAENIPAAAGAIQGSETLVLPGWSVAPGDVAYYQTNYHQCVRVVLDAKAAGVTFKNTAAYRNMDFRQAMSPFTGTATIGTKGYRGADQDSIDFALSAYTYNAPPGARWDTRIARLNQVRAGQFRLRASTREDARISTTVLPPAIAIPRVEMHVPPTTGFRNAPLRIPVRAGTLVTILARGSVRLRGDTAQGGGKVAGPDGIDLGDSTAAGEYPLPRERRPWRRAGAVLASWTGTERGAFFVGSARTLRVPGGVQMLTLALNDTPDGARQHRGEGYTLEVIQTPLESYFSDHNPIVSRDFSTERSVIPLGSNLPTWILCGRVQTSQKIEQDGVVADLVTTAGCYGSMLTRIGP